jgi:prevent-host-death family protein
MLGESMLNLSTDIQSLTDFKRHTAEFIDQIKATGQPLVLTVNGKAELVVQDAASYQDLLELKERMETVEALRKSLESVHNGRTRPLEEVFEELRQKYEVPR